jgi:predicted SAM-dependent methyltransferase
MTTEQMNIIINIQAMQKKVHGHADSTEKLGRYKLDALREIQYDMIEQWNMDLKVKKMRLIIDEQSVGIYIGPDEFVRWTTDEVQDDPEVALIMAKAVELFYTNPKQLLQL